MIDLGRSFYPVSHDHLTEGAAGIAVIVVTILDLADIPTAVGSLPSSERRDIRPSPVPALVTPSTRRMTAAPLQPSPAGYARAKPPD